MSYGLDDGDSFRVRYLGSITFRSGKRQGGIDSLQRPLLDLYTTARRRGETQRSAHPLALTQQLDVSNYGLVVAEAEDQENGESVAVVTKVITPVSNITLWAAVRFHTRIVKRKVFGAAFVPLACSEGAVDQKSYIQLGSKQRFLVSLTHPSLFACLLRRVSAPKSFECHAFVCATAEDALTLSSVLGDIKDGGDNPTSLDRVVGGRPRYGLVSRSVLSDNMGSSFCTVDESPSDITPPVEPGHYTRSYLARSNPDFTAGQPVPTGRALSPEMCKFRTDSEEDSPSDITLSKIMSSRPQPQSDHVSRGRTVVNVHRPDTPSSDRRKMTNRPLPPIFSRKERKKDSRAKFKHHAHSSAAGAVSRSSGHEIISPKGGRSGARAKAALIPRTVDLGSESELWSERTEERWEPAVDWQSRGARNNYRSKVFIKNGGRRGSSTTSGDSYLPSDVPHRKMGSTQKKDMATMTDVVWETENSVLSATDEVRPSPPYTVTSYADEREREDTCRRPGASRCREEMELSETMDLSSESELSARDSEPWSAGQQQQRKVKYTYFGYETYCAPSAPDQVRVGTPCSIVPARRTESKRPDPARPLQGARRAVRNAETQADDSTRISSNDLGKITISVPYRRRATSPRNGVLSNGRTGHVPHGVRSFQKTGHVKNWSTLSQTSDLSYQGSATLPPPKAARQNKVIRWSSDDRLPRRYGFLASLKRLSLKSLTKAKNKTGKFISSVRTRLKERGRGKKTSEGSEDSAYDTSEVCLSPNGHHVHPVSSKKTRRRLSWSFHDLRTADGCTTTRRARMASPPGSALGASSARQLVHKRKHRRRRHRHLDGSPSSSDSGVEEYHSDYSDTLNSFQKSESEMEQFAAEITQVRVRHGMSKEAFHRWSQTNLQDELGYIP